MREIEDPAGADAAAHEHRNVLWTPDDRPDLLSAEEIIEDLRDAWQLDLNIDPTRNVDDTGQDLGLTPWRCVVRDEAGKRTRYAEVLLKADCLLHAEELAYDATIGLMASAKRRRSEAGMEPEVIAADRLTPGQLEEAIAELGTDGRAPTVPEHAGVIAGRWIA